MSTCPLSKSDECYCCTVSVTTCRLILHDDNTGIVTRHREVWKLNFDYILSISNEINNTQIYQVNDFTLLPQVRQRARSLTPGGESRLRETTAEILRDVRDSVESARRRGELHHKFSHLSFRK